MREPDWVHTRDHTEGTLLGVKLILDPSRVDVHEDWSGVRSPARAARRLRQGHPQRVVVTRTPQTKIVAFRSGGTDHLVLHPDMRREAVRRVVATHEQKMAGKGLGLSGLRLELIRRTWELHGRSILHAFRGMGGTGRKFQQCIAADPREAMRTFDFNKNPSATRESVETLLFELRDGGVWCEELLVHDLLTGS